MEDIKLGYARVSDVLDPLSGYGNIPKHILEAAQIRGTKAHTAIEEFLKGIGTWGADEQTLAYVESAKLFWKPEYEVLCQEQRFYNDKHMVTGKCDIIIKHNDRHILLDWKTSAKENKIWALQGSAYAYLAEEDGYKIDDIWFVKLSKAGAEPEVFKYGNPQKRKELFFYCIEIFNHCFRDRPAQNILEEI